VGLHQLAALASRMSARKMVFGGVATVVLFAALVGFRWLAKRPF